MVLRRFIYTTNLALALMGLAALCGCQSAAQSQRAEAPPPLVVVTTLSASDVPVVSDYPAQTYARNTVDVRGRVDGYLDKWLFHPGQEVHSGDVLYVLDVRPYQAAVEQAKGNVAQSEADLEFARKQVALLQAEASLAAAQANLIKARKPPPSRSWTRPAPPCTPTKPTSGPAKPPWIRPASPPRRRFRPRRRKWTPSAPR